MEAIKEANCLPETFSVILIALQKEAAGRHITIGDRQSGKIVRILEKARLLKRKAEILWRFGTCKSATEDLFLDVTGGRSVFFPYKSFFLLIPLKGCKPENLHESLFVFR